MRFALVFLSALVLSALAVAQPARNWIVVAGPIGGYLADFPAQPAVQQSDDGVRNGRRLISHLQAVEIDGGDKFFAISSTDMGDVPADDADRDRKLANVRDSIVASNAGNVLLSSTGVTVDGVNGIDFVFDVPAYKARIRHRLFMSGSILVQQMASGRPGIETSPDTARFVASLRLTR